LTSIVEDCDIEAAEVFSIREQINRDDLPVFDGEVERDMRHPV
jgi:hypothetical protein